MMPDFEKFRVGSTDYNVKDASAAHVYVGSGTAPAGTTIKIDPDGDAAEFVEEAPNDGQQYARKNKAWAVVQGGGGTTSPWSGKNVLVLGDSGSDTATYHNNWWQKLSSELGFNTPTVKAYPGYGITAIVGNCTASDVTGKDLIIIEAGANDRGTSLGKVGDLYPTQSTVCGKVKYAIETIYTLLSNANNLKCRVMFFAPYCFGEDQDGHDGYFYDISGLSQAMEDTANYDGLPCYNAYKESGINSHTWSVYMASAADHVHLNLSGNALIGKSISQFIRDRVLPYEQVNG